MSHVPVSKELRTAIEHFYEYILTSTKSPFERKCVQTSGLNQLCEELEYLERFNAITYMHMMHLCTLYSLRDGLLF